MPLTAADKALLGAYVRSGLENKTALVDAYRTAGGVVNKPGGVLTRLKKMLDGSDVEVTDFLAQTRARFDTESVKDDAERAEVDRAKWRASKAKIDLQRVTAEALTRVIPIVGESITPGNTKSAAGFSKLCDSSVKVAAKLENDDTIDFSAIATDLRRLGIDTAKMAQTGETLDAVLAGAVKPKLKEGTVTVVMPEGGKA